MARKVFLSAPARCGRRAGSAVSSLKLKDGRWIKLPKNALTSKLALKDLDQDDREPAEDAENLAAVRHQLMLAVVKLFVFVHDQRHERQ